MNRKLAAITAAGVIALALAGCSMKSGSGGPAIDNSSPSTSASPTPTAAANHQALYEVTSDGGTANMISYLTFANGQSGQESANGAALPFSKTVDLGKPGAFNYTSLTLTAQAGEGATTITCKISIDGVVKATQTSTGQYAVVTCNATNT